MSLKQGGNLLILLVPGTRIELVRGQASRDFKSLASTYSATQAQRHTYNEHEFIVKEYTALYPSLHALICFRLETPWGQKALLLSSALCHSNHSVKHELEGMYYSMT